MRVPLVELHGGEGVVEFMLESLTVRLHTARPASMMATRLVRRSHGQARRKIILPTDAPSPASMDQIVAAGDITGDGKTDFFALVGTVLWALIGYHGAIISSATRLMATLWDERDLLTGGDVTGDVVADLIYRTAPDATLRLRKGITNASGSGVDLNSPASGANSADGTAS
ncbi:hypothetical protein HBK87_07745 [Streptomyces sp. 2BBP-J2]|uniref:hypothetical protein n=1 Tax=Streptomyces sp. 2BBP-J2 TaxID=2719381 RepID=UPI001431F7F4|nr:hypothetical protein [Streptomyces sp. 2BBP-J2]NIL50483.1 hypothetical protein [Streptomyces sp. 2BBP-J2]